MSVGAEGIGSDAAPKQGAGKVSSALRTPVPIPGFAWPGIEAARDGGNGLIVGERHPTQGGTLLRLAMGCFAGRSSRRPALNQM